MLAKYPAYACYVDSRKAGNCGTGTDNWMNKQAIADSHILVSRLEKFNDSRVLDVAAFATRRHITELKAGVCLLVDHDADTYRASH